MDNYSKIQEGVKLISEAFVDMAKKFAEACRSITNGLNPVLKRKLTKKKFCKLLQSYGIQRNEIALIVKNNGRTYTYGYLYEILSNKEG